MDSSCLGENLSKIIVLFLKCNENVSYGTIVHYLFTGQKLKYPALKYPAGKRCRLVGVYSSWYGDVIRYGWTLDLCLLKLPPPVWFDVILFAPDLFFICLNCIGIVYGLGDCIAQLMFEKERTSKKYDVVRTIRMSFIGFSFTVSNRTT